MQKKSETTYCAGLRAAMQNYLPLRRGVISIFHISRSARNLGLTQTEKALCDEAEEELPSIEDIDAPPR